MSLGQIKFSKGRGGRIPHAVNPQKQYKAPAQPKRWLTCKVRSISLDNGETLKRGCGRAGLMPSDVGWRCFYCGNYVYRNDPPLDALWFHFKMGREYWRGMSREGKHFINGVPVAGSPDCLPSYLLADLTEPRPPKWFRFFVIFDADQFERYLERSRNETR